ncbi:hypothetical protein NQ314_000492 [Rhamnusium bicolor]|uniref:protein S-acyltransferase n=1 Tax=Rhamnusium bicolor TaxID=1586634 RepID=A0AAV8ZUF9_9CUCU|nr:hypothetical protein NQ314_000492 [Rhamnusium bicolor]
MLLFKPKANQSLYEYCFEKLSLIRRMNLNLSGSDEVNLIVGSLDNQNVKFAVKAACITDPSKLAVYLKSFDTGTFSVIPQKYNNQVLPFKKGASQSLEVNSRYEGKKVGPCYKCKQPGHKQYNCPQNFTLGDRSKLHCNYCRNKGHTIDNCYKKLRRGQGSEPRPGSSNTRSDKQVLLISRDGDKNKFYKLARINETIEIQCFIDFGSECSLITAGLVKQLNLEIVILPKPVVLTVFGGSEIEVFSMTSCKLSVDSVCLPIELLVVERCIPGIEVVIGQNFTEDYQIKYSRIGHELLFTNASLNVNVIGSVQEVHDRQVVRVGIDQPEVQSRIKIIVEGFPICFPSKNSRLGCISGVKMTIKLKSDTPIVQRPYRLAEAEKVTLRELIDELMQDETIRPSQSPFASPVIMVKKKTGRSRLCTADHHPVRKAECKRPDYRLTVECYSSYVFADDGEKNMIKYMTVDLDYQLVDLWSLQSESNMPQHIYLHIIFYTVIISGTDTSTDMAQEREIRKWEVFHGRNRFYCDGRLMTAPNSGVFLLTIFLITLTSTLFFIFDCKYLAENVTIAIPIIGGLLFLFTMSSLLRTSLSDPGIIPRATSEEAAYVEKQIEVTNSANSPTYRPPPRTKEVLVKGQTIKLKYCFTCKIFRPPRASHCSLCDNCVDRFDHHCPWVGNCVGRRNYRYFYMFIVSLAFLAVFIFACAVAHLILITKDDRQFLDAVKESPPSVIVAIICFFSVWSILGLAGFHTYLTTSNQTTNEDIKGSFTSKRGQESFNPYSQGNVCLNCFHILCGPVTPSLIDRRGLVTDNYRSEISRPVTNEPTLQLKNYGLHMQNGPQQLTVNATEMPGIYRQTTETTGMYSPLKKHLYRAQQIIPSKNCATQKVIPSQAPLLPPYDYHKKASNNPPLEVFKNSHSLPQLKNIVHHVDSHEYDDFYQFYAQSRQGVDNRYDSPNNRHEPPPPPIDTHTRPYTPPEKRYSSNFGQPKEQKPVRKARPRSSCVYENIHVKDEYCIINKVKSDRSLNYTPNVRVSNFPMPENLYSESNAGSITHLVTSEQPLAIAPAVQLQRSLEDSQQYKSQPSLNHSPVYNNIVTPSQVPLGKSHSYADNLNSTIEKQAELKETTVNVEDLHLDPVVLRESHILANISENTKFPDLKLDNDLTLQEKRK